MTIWTSYQGIEVVESDPNVPCRHPRWGYDPKRLAKLKGASLLGLADGSFVVVCNDCGFNGVTGNAPYVKPEVEKQIIKQSDSVMSHRNGTHNLSAPRGPMYTEDEIKVAIKVWLKWKSTGIRTWGQAACDELERSGFKPYHSPKWRPSQLGHLVNNYIKKPEFKNLKAASLSDSDRELLAAVRDSAARESGRKSSVAANARITASKHKRTPINFSEIIATSEAAKAARQEVGAVPDPTLNFVTQRTSDDVETPKAMVIETGDVSFKPVPGSHERLANAVAVAAYPLQVEGDFKHITDLPDGSPMFTYKGVLMVGKPIKGVEI